MYDPDIFIGYNIILKFDWKYLIKRSSILGIYNKFRMLGRIYGKPAALIDPPSWTSSAYKEQNFYISNVMVVLMLTFF